MAAANRAAEKAQEAHQLAEALTAILNVHRTDFEPAPRPIAPEPPAVDTGAVLAAQVKLAKASTSVFSRAARKAAIAEARHRADAEVAATTAVYREQQAAWQVLLDAQWEELNANAPDAVLAALAEAFEDNDAAAAAVGVDDDEVTLVVIVPGSDSVPERQPTVTAAGNLSLKKMTKRDRSDLYKLLVCGHVLVTLKEAFAVAPAIASARVIAVRPTATDAYGDVRPEVVLAGVFERKKLEGVKWADADAVRVINDTKTELIFLQRGTTQQLVPVDLSKEPELQAVVATVAFEDLLP